MVRPASKWCLLVMTGLCLVGCTQNPHMTPQQMAAWQQQSLQPQQGQAYDLNRRATALDANNRDLHTQLAQSRQQVDLLRQQVTTLQQQLGDTANRLQEMQVAKAETDRQVQALQASNGRGGAIITANRSTGGDLRKIEIPGVTVRQDGNTVRIELPTDQLFSPGTSQVVGSAFPILDGVAAEIARNYPRQRIGIEGHVDSSANGSAYGGVSSHQLSAVQAIAVFDMLTRRNRLPTNQFHVGGQGANQPLSSDDTQAGRARNRRVELVVYPETVGT